VDEHFLLAVVDRLDRIEDAGGMTTSWAERISACTSLGKHERRSPFRGYMKLYPIRGSEPMPRTHLLLFAQAARAMLASSFMKLNFSWPAWRFARISSSSERADIHDDQAVSWLRVNGS